MAKYAFALALTGIAALACAVPALGADDPLTGYYGNTVISTGGMAEIHTHYRADHTFDLTGSMMGMSRSFKGTWTVAADGKICRTFVGEMPPRTTNPVCSLIAPHKAGETWTAASSDGSTRTFTIKPGIE